MQSRGGGVRDGRSMGDPAVGVFGKNISRSTHAGRHVAPDRSGVTKTRRFATEEWTHPAAPTFSLQMPTNTVSYSLAMRTIIEA